MLQSSRILKVAAGLAIVIAGVATAQTRPKEGRYDYTSCYSSVSNAISFSKTPSANTYELMGTILSNPQVGSSIRAPSGALE